MKPTRPRPDQVEYFRPGLLPGILGSLAVLTGLFAFKSEWFITVQFAVSILSAIMIAFALQGRTVRPRVTFIFTPLLAVVVIVWNPIVNLTTNFTGQAWMLSEVAAAIVVFFAGMLIKTVAPKR
jgi:bacteriorhodopsin